MLAYAINKFTIMKELGDTNYQTITNIKEIRMKDVYKNEQTHFNIAFGLFHL